MSDREPCPTCDRDLWHVGHVCYTYADLAMIRSRIAQTAGSEVASSQVGEVPPTGFEPVEPATIDAGQTA